MKVRRKYLQPQCTIVNCEFTSVILADSQQRSNRAPGSNSNATHASSWGSIWEN